MSGHSNADWYPNRHGTYSPDPTTAISTGARAMHTNSQGGHDAVYDAHRLFAAYPPASATPSAHVTRHISNLSNPAPPPTYMQANYSAFHTISYQTHPSSSSPFSDYSRELTYLSDPSTPAQHSQYWQATRNESVRYLSYGTPVNQYSFSPPSNWTLTPTNSSYNPPAIANSVLQRFNPTSAYPTPPPPGIRSSSSSLAFALGYPSQAKSQPRVYKPEESGPFFKDFLNRSAQLLDSKPNQPTNTHQQSPSKVESLPPNLPPPPAVPQPSVTPRKRKSPDDLITPSRKRIHAANSTNSPSNVRFTSETPSLKSSKSSRQVLAYVNIPPPTWKTTPSTKSFSGDLASGDESADEDHPRRNIHVDIKSSARRTRDKDERAPLERLNTLIEDILEAEDSLAADIEPADLPKEYFSPLTVDCNHPHLQPSIVRKLTKYISQLARPSKRSRRPTREGVANAGSGSKARDTLGDIGTPTLSRLMKILERSIKAGEDLDPLRTSTHHPPPPSSPSKSKKGHKVPADGIDVHEDRPTVHDSHPQQLTDSDVHQLTVHLEVSRDSILAAECCMALLSGEGLTKQLYSEELITTCLSTVKNQLTMVVYPFVEGTGVSGATSPQLNCILRYTHSSCGELRRLLTELFQALAAALPRINSLFSADGVSMSDAIIIQAVYIAIGPFFVVESAESDTKGKRENVVLSTLGNSAMRGLRLDALSIIRSVSIPLIPEFNQVDLFKVFANHEDQRSWIIEEILSSLIKLSNSHKKAGQFRLRDGRSIRTVSALLLQLVQTSARDVRIAARNISKTRQNRALRNQDSTTEKAKDVVFDEQDVEEIQLYMSGLDSANNAAKTIVLFLTQRYLRVPYPLAYIHHLPRSGKGKLTKNSNEAEYRIILDNLISDLLVVLYWPEWPAASLILSVICKFMVASLDDVKTSVHIDTNAAKAIALDHLGVIAARLRSSTIKVRQRCGKHPLIPLDEILSTENVQDFKTLLARHEAISFHLLKRSSDDQAYESARELTSAVWGHELANALRILRGALPSEDDGRRTQKSSATLNLCLKLRTALSEVWTHRSTDVFDVGSEEEAARVDLLAEEIGTVQNLRSSFGPILNVVLMALDAPPVFMRTKALRALGQIVTSDSSILSTVSMCTFQSGAYTYTIQANVRRAIEGHLLDSSPAVRDAAVELIGRYMIESPEVVGDYYSRIADRIADTGLGVRKRVIKLLKQYYGVTEDLARRVDICTKLVLRMLDEDDTVKDLAVKTMEELWFQNTPSQAAPPKGKPPSSSNTQDKTSLLMKVSIIMGVSAYFKDKQSPLEDLLHKIMSSQNPVDAPSMHAKYSEICETLIDGLVDASDLPGFVSVQSINKCVSSLSVSQTVQSCIRMLYLFATAYPSVLSGSNASTLLPYLKNPASPEELAVTDYLLRVFRISIPHMPKTALKFGQELQSVLQPMIVKPSNVGGVVCLQESVACLCGSVQHLTHDFHRLIALLKSCNARIQQAIVRRDAAMSAVETRTLSILIFIVSLLGEHCDFDQLRVERPEFATELNGVSEGHIVEHIYNSLLSLYAKYSDAGLKGRILQCLGFLFRTQPTLMTLERSAGIMDAIFASPDEDSRGRLLRIMQEFLVSEAAKHAEHLKGSGQGKGDGVVDMAELVGNTEGFADSGVSSAVVQRYISPILEAALSQNPQIQAVAVDILTFTVKQGLAHPLQSFPIIVALETSPVVATSVRASALHAILYNKHMSLLNARFIVSARQSFDYQRVISPNIVQGRLTFESFDNTNFVTVGYRMQPEPTALLQRWYSLVREKRAPRQDFLKALVKAFDIPTALKSSQDDVDFSRYMAENFAILDYKTQEEAFTVIKHLTSILSTSGMQLIEVVSPSNLLAQLHEPQQQSTPNPNDTHVTNPTPQPPLGANLNVDVMRTSVIICIVMLLKSHLKVLYGFSEEKCSKFVPGKKSAVGDKPAVKRHQFPISWDRLPFAMAPLILPEHLAAQKATFLQIWNEDGVVAEPEDVLE
ncbi:sister chromatid cohesion C-terminus-domain-containing protein [Boletus reticuloceps]|uniref:Sister chromatid cohesion protein n=1 Tax=Boletus reticuloceps TaxID=495285 RepID=A0A8I2YN68_9AGAM|nr:sister chromatid cohesion C-terminus-domain-containing protein [Boletus reticuloceps]KAG6375984.1 sister chromatid cohesion C-terminus-domain-containing protein [Boletus reticuloceps]